MGLERKNLQYFRDVTKETIHCLHKWLYHYLCVLGVWKDASEIGNCFLEPWRQTGVTGPSKMAYIIGHRRIQQEIVNFIKRWLMYLLMISLKTSKLEYLGRDCLGIPFAAKELLHLPSPPNAIACWTQD